MPKVRRSTRIHGKKSSQIQVEFQNNISNAKSPHIKTENETESETESDQELQECIACKQKHPPIRRYPQDHWIQCDNCDEWWHVECACVTREDKDRLNRFKLVILVPYVY